MAAIVVAVDLAHSELLVFVAEPVAELAVAISAIILDIQLAFEFLLGHLTRPYSVHHQ